LREPAINRITSVHLLLEIMLTAAQQKGKYFHKIIPLVCTYCTLCFVQLHEPPNLRIKSSLSLTSGA